jgi:hypothetical protein
MLDMRQEFRAFAHEVCAAAQSSTGRTHLGRRDRGLGHQAAAQEGRNLL